MSEHSTHCKDPHCYGCSCTPDCDYRGEEYGIGSPEVMAAAKLIDSGNLPLNPSAYTSAVFDGFRKAWMREERERIIALLATVTAIHPETLRATIALIKGETE